MKVEIRYLNTKTNIYGEIEGKHRFAYIEDLKEGERVVLRIDESGERLSAEQIFEPEIYDHYAFTFDKSFNLVGSKINSEKVELTQGTALFLKHMMANENIAPPKRSFIPVLYPVINEEEITDRDLEANLRGQMTRLRSAIKPLEIGQYFKNVRGTGSYACINPSGQNYHEGLGSLIDKSSSGLLIIPRNT